MRLLSLALLSSLFVVGPAVADRKIDGAGKKSISLPAGIELKRMRIVQGNVSAPLPLPRPDRMAAEIDSVNIKDDGSATIQFANFCNSLTPMQLRPKELEARLADAEGLGLRNKRELAGAVAAFRRAWTLDPDLIEAAAHLAGTLAAQGDSAEAGRVLTTAARAPVPLYAALLQEPGFASLQSLPALAQLRVNPPGTATMPKDASAAFAPAVQPATGLLALRITDGGGGCECCDRSELLIVDPRSDAVVAAMPLEMGGDWGTTPTASGGCKLKRPRAAVVSQRLAAASQLLRDLGFVTAKDLERADLESIDGNMDHRKTLFPRSRIGVAARFGQVRALRGDTTLGQVQLPGLPREAMYIPAAKVIVITGAAHTQEGCAGTDAPVFSLLHLNNPQTPERPPQ